MDPRRPPSLQDVRTAAEAIAGVAHRTPVITCTSLDRLAGAQLFFKAENLQKGGAFKFRGATFAVKSLSDTEAARGVATHSSGNHAQALALAAKTRGIPAYIVMPRDSMAAKRAAVESYGGQITECEPTLTAREETLASVVRTCGAEIIHPYDDARIIAGQGTAALELLEEVPDLDAIVAPVGGGGLLAGTAIAGRGLRPSIRIVGAEPTLADDAHRSLETGVRQPPRPPQTVADGLRTALGELNFAILRETVDEIALVGETGILEAMRLLWERAKLVVEPSGAVPLAALLSHAPPARQRIGVILSGGNVDLCRNPSCNFWH
jgi:threonine dehydratase